MRLRCSFSYCLLSVTTADIHRPLRAFQYICSCCYCCDFRVNSIWNSHFICADFGNSWRSRFRQMDCCRNDERSRALFRIYCFKINVMMDIQCCYNNRQIFQLCPLCMGIHLHSLVITKNGTKSFMRWWIRNVDSFIRCCVSCTFIHTAGRQSENYYINICYN